MKMASKLFGCLVAFGVAQACATSASSSTSAQPVIPTPDLPKPEKTRVESETPTHMLFVGNSYFYYNDSLHNHVHRMVVAAGLAARSELSYKSATVGGAALFDHNIDHLLDPKNLRVDKPFEIVILQGGSVAALSEERRKLFAETAISYAAKIRQAGGEPVLYMTHAYVKPHRRYRPGMISDIASLYIETGNSIDALVIPVGLAFEEAYRRRPDIQLHKNFDGSHPDMLGTYLAAATVFASIYGHSPIGNDYDYFGAVDRDDALFLQTVAQDVVTRFYRRDR